MLIKPQLAYPGVYVAEVPARSGGIPAIPTSIAAFVGRSRVGPTDAPVLINSFGDFEAQFGGLWSKSPLSYAVKQFYDNGGSQAYIVRICATPDEIERLGEAVGYDPKVDPATGAPSSSPIPYAQRLGLQPVTPEPQPGASHGDGCARINVSPTAAAQAPGERPTGGLQFVSANPGTWGDAIRVELDRTGIDAHVAAALQVDEATLFNMTVRCAGSTERYSNVSVHVDAGARRLDRVLSTSQFIRYGDDSSSLDALKAVDLAGIVALHQVTYREGIDTDEAYLARLPRGAGGGDGYFLGDAGLFSGDQSNQKGIYQLDKVDIFNLLVIPRDRFEPVPLSLDYTAIFNYVHDRRAFWILDVPAEKLSSWDAKILRGEPGVDTLINDDFANPGELGRNAAVFYPDLMFPDPLAAMAPKQFGPAGAVAGIFARTDASRGIWKAPAGTEATVTGLVGLTARLNDAQNGVANLQAINCFREMPPAGTVLWGSRTLRGAQALVDAFKYIPVRRLSLYVEESVRRGLQWAVFETNDETLWATIRARLDDFMTGLMRQGAFQGSTKAQAFFVRCGLGETMTAQDIDNGVCNVQIGFAPIKPAEFVVLYFEQMTADSQG